MSWFFPFPPLLDKKIMNLILTKLFTGTWQLSGFSGVFASVGFS
jgi:hypothetical protein